MKRTARAFATGAAIVLVPFIAIAVLVGAMWAAMALPFLLPLALWAFTEGAIYRTRKDQQ